MSTTITHKKDKKGKPILDEVFVNSKFLFLSEYFISKGNFTIEEQKAIEQHLNVLGYEID